MNRARSIAIVGMDCRFPGGADSPGRYWDMLDSGRHFSCPLPTDRGWDLEWLSAPDSGATGHTRISRGSFLGDVSGFDAGFFGVSPREAVLMDPQQRLLLESTWKAIESSRIAPGSLSGSRTGVYIGVSHYNYGGPVGRRRWSGDADVHIATGSASSVASGRISHVLDLHGPAMSVDTACSSSLVALHLAVLALRAGDCDLAIVGGVSVMTTPELLVGLGRAGALTGDGKCKAFAADADGFAPSEGVATVLLMPLARALATDRPVLAVIRGSAVDNDGSGDGLTVPNGTAQRALIAEALADAGLSPGQVDLVEAHGTGTKVGDPIEARSIQAAYGSAHTPELPVWVGSAKSNIGHTQAAAGLAGLIKAVLALRHEKMPATLHAEVPTPEVDWSPGTMRLLRQARDWPRGVRVRRCGVLAYGISGTNAHVIVEEAPEVAQDSERTGDRSVFAWPLSAKSDAALRAQSAALAEWVRDNPAHDPADVGWSLAATRDALPERAVVVGNDTATLLAGLDELATTGEVPESAGARARARDVTTGPVFVFPGQGGQWLGMGARLLEESTVFADAVRRCAGALRTEVGFDVVDVLRGEAGARGFDSAAVVQPATFAMYVGLAELWRAHGVRPAAVIGHSQGEIAAAYVAGALTLRDAARVVATRSATLRRISGKGAMVSLALPDHRAADLLTPWRGRLVVAAVNGPAATTVAGDVDAAEELLRSCEDGGVWARRVPVDYASHCAHVDVVREDILDGLADLRSTAPSVQIFSSATGGPMEKREMDAEYWYRGLRQPVLFDSAVRNALARGHRYFVEVSPHPVLLGAVRDIAADAGTEVCTVQTMSRDDSGTPAFTRALAQAYARGVELDWSVMHPGAEEVDLPTYRFQHRSYWHDAQSQSADHTSAGLEPVEHPWLVAMAELPDGTAIHNGRISLTTQPWLSDHAVRGVPLLPATGMLELLLFGATRSGRDRLEDVVLHAPLRLTEDFVGICVQVKPSDTAGRQWIGLYSRSKNPMAPWACHAEASAVRSTSAPADVDVAPDPGAAIDVPGHYRTLEGEGYDYGPAFRNLTAAWRVDDGTCHTEAHLNETAASPRTFGVHPALLDAALHGVLVTANQRLWLPHTIDSVTIHMRGATALRTTIVSARPDRLDVRATDLSGKPVITMEGFRLRAVTGRTLRAVVAAGEHVTWRTSWRPVGETAPEEHVPVPGQIHDSLATMITTLTSGAPAPEVVWLDCRADPVPCTTPPETVELASRVRERLRRLLADLQTFMTEPRLERSRLVVLTRGAQSTHSAESVEDLAAAACAGMIRAVQGERPRTVQLIDVDTDTPDADLLAAAAATGLPELALRGGLVLVPRLVSAHDDVDRLQLPADGSPWRLVPASAHTIQDIGVVPAPERISSLADDHVRVRVRATGMNFRDAFLSLGLVDATELGCEVVGVVVATGARARRWQVGDLVAGLSYVEGGYAPLVDVDYRHLVPVRPEWTVAEAAGIPAVFFTAYHVLVEMAEVKRGDKVLIHAAAGGVGMAAVQLARARGAEVYATASPRKHHVVSTLGIPPERIANSRTLDFEAVLRRATGGTGFDVVLGSLSGDFVDASLRLLRVGGQYLEVGKADVRDEAEMAQRHPGVIYRSWSGAVADLEEFGRAFTTLAPLFETGTLRPLPTQTRDVRHVKRALRDIAQGRTIGKTVLTQPIELDPEGTVLITGGTGQLGRLLATHLATTYRVRHVVLASRSGAAAPGLAELEAELARRGIQVVFATCDVTDRDSLAEVIAGIPASRPLTAVVHAAGVLDDGLVTTQTPERFENVLRVKVDAALHLHDLTRHMDLRAFVIYTSFAGVLGMAAQSNYAAANAFLDAFAHHRRRIGLPAIAIAWGLWQEASGLTAHLTAADVRRFGELGVGPMTTGQGLCGFDAALDLDLPQVTVAALKQMTDDQAIPALLADLPRRHVVRSTVADGGAQGQAVDRAALVSQPASERLNSIIALVRTHAAAILGHSRGEDVPADQPFRGIGFDSLASVELRTRLSNVLGVRLAATAIYDHPTPEALARHVAALITTSDQPAAANNGHSNDPLVTRVLDAWHTGDLAAVRRMLDDASSGRTVSEVSAPPEWRRLSANSAHQQLLCLAPILSRPGASPFGRLAAELAGTGELWTADLQGYRADEALPRTLNGLFDRWADAVPTDRTRPIHVLGYSTGGVLAREFARALRRRGVPVASLILIDPVTPATQPASARDEIVGELTRTAALLNSAMLEAAHHYEQLVAGSVLDSAVADPTLVIRAHEVTGSHLSMVNEHATKTAALVIDWLGRGWDRRR